MILTTQHRSSVPLRYVSDILQTEEAFTLEEYKHTHTHTLTHTHTHTHTKTLNQFLNLSRVNGNLEMCMPVLLEVFNESKHF